MLFFFDFSYLTLHIYNKKMMSTQTGQTIHTPYQTITQNNETYNPQSHSFLAYNLSNNHARY